MGKGQLMPLGLKTTSFLPGSFPLSSIAIDRESWNPSKVAILPGPPIGHGFQTLHLKTTEIFLLSVGLHGTKKSFLQKNSQVGRVTSKWHQPFSSHGKPRGFVNPDFRSLWEDYILVPNSLLMLRRFHFRLQQVSQDSI